MSGRTQRGCSTRFSHRRPAGGTLALVFEPINTREKFEHRVRLGSSTPAHEDMRLEFKGMPHHKEQDQRQRQKEQREVARDITQFANSEGGTVLYGVNERKDPRTGAVTADGLVPIPSIEDARDWIVKAISRYVYPKTPLAKVEPLHVSGGTVIAVNTGPSIGLQGVWDSGVPTQGMEFLYRNNNKKEQMTMDEVALRMSSNTARAMRLRFLEFEEKFNKVTVKVHHYAVTNPSIPPSIQKLEETVTIVNAGPWALQLSVGGAGRKEFEVPYDWIESLWIGNDHGAQRLNIFIRGRIFVNKEVTLRPHR